MSDYSILLRAHEALKVEHETARAELAAALAIIDRHNAATAAEVPAVKPQGRKH